MNCPQCGRKLEPDDKKFCKTCCQSHRGKTGELRPDKRCSECGGSGFSYRNGSEYSEDGVRGYRCMQCGTIKPEGTA